MTISNEITFVQVMGNGAQTTFSYGFLVPQQAFATLYLTEADGNQIEIPQGDWTLNGAGNPSGGTFVYPKTGGTPAAAGSFLTLVRGVRYSNLTNLINQGAYYPAAVEGALDFLAMQTQQLAAAIQRCLRFPLCAPTGGDTELSNYTADGVRNSLVGFDDSGNISLYRDLGPEVPVSALGAELISDATLPEMWSTLGFSTLGTELISDATVSDMWSTLALSSVALLSTMQFQQDGTGAVERTVLSKMREPISALDFGAAPGAAAAVNDAARVNAEALATATGGQVYWPEGDYDVLTIPTPGVSWGPAAVFVSGTREYLHPVPGPFSVTYAEAFGLVNDTDDTGNAAKIQRAIDFAQDTMNKPAVVMPRGWHIRLTEQLVIKQGQGATDPKIYEMDFNHNACVYLPTFADHAINVQPQCTVADRSTGRGQGKVSNYDGTVNNYLNSGAKGVRIGRQGYWHYPFQWGQLHDFNFAVVSSEAIVLECGKVDVHNVCGMNAGAGISIYAYDNGLFTGDITITNAEFQGDASNAPLTLAASSAGSLTELRGVKINNSNFYGNGTSIACTGNANIGDIWVTDTAISFEPGLTGPAGTGLTLYVGPSARMFNIFIVDAYIGGFNGNAIQVVGDVARGATYNIRIESDIHDNVTTGATVPAVVLVERVDGVYLSSRFFGDTTTLTAAFTNCNNWSAVNCASQNETGASTGIYAGSGCDYFVIAGNRMAATAAATVAGGSGTHSVVANNLAST